jgi:predicted double-glycine peptidase
VSSWVEAFAVALLAVSGVVLGRWFSRLPGKYWLAGYFIPLALVLLYGLGMRDPTWSLVPPISWMMAGRAKFAVIGFIAAMVLTTPLSRLPRRRDRVLVSSFIVVVVLLMSVWPFLAPAFNRSYLAGLQTRIDSDGVCRQSNDYNCGPAAAVTALRRLGLPAEEGEIAILAHTSTAIGTPPDMLAAALQKRYGADGLTAEYRILKDIPELKGAGLVLAIIKFNFFMDHYVAVLDVDDAEILVGDPLNGLTRLSHEEFRKRWRFVGVVLNRES